MSELELAYLAGIVDADGYVTATYSRHKGRLYVGAQVGITGSCRPPHDLASAMFGGNVTTHRPTRNPTHRIQYHWQRTGRSAVEPISALLPYLRIKANRALLVLELQSIVEEIAAFKAEGGAPWLAPNHDRTGELEMLVEDIRGASSPDHFEVRPVVFQQWGGWAEAPVSEPPHGNLLDGQVVEQRPAPEVVA